MKKELFEKRALSNLICFSCVFCTDVECFFLNNQLLLNIRLVVLVAVLLFRQLALLHRLQQSVLYSGYFFG